MLAVEVDYVEPSKFMHSRVIAIDTVGEAWGRVPELLFEEKGHIPAIQQLLISKLNQMSKETWARFSLSL